MYEILLIFTTSKPLAASLVTNLVNPAAVDVFDKIAIDRSFSCILVPVSKLDELSQAHQPVTLRLSVGLVQRRWQGELQGSMLHFGLFR